MAKKYKCILNIGTAEVSLTAVAYDKNVFGRRFYAKHDHGGINNNFFKTPEKVFFAIEKLLKSYYDNVDEEPSDIYLIMPQRFFRFKHNVKDFRIESGIVNKFDVEDVVAGSIVEIEDCDKLECVPIAYKVNDDYIDNPIGQECSVIQLVSASIGILTRIKEFFVDISKRLNVCFVYVPSVQPLLNKLQKNLMTNRSSRVVVYCNEDYIDVCYCEMCAVIAEKTIEVGNKDFVSALATTCQTDETSARALIKHINFNLSGGEYVVWGENVQNFRINDVNNTVKKLYDYLITEIKNALSSLIGEAVLPIYVAGDDICNIRGLDSYLSDKIGAPVHVLTADTLVWNTPSDYNVLGLIESIL